jgi:hypothetical protein
VKVVCGSLHYDHLIAPGNRATQPSEECYIDPTRAAKTKESRCRCNLRGSDDIAGNEEDPLTRYRLRSIDQAERVFVQGGSNDSAASRIHREYG